MSTCFQHLCHKAIVVGGFLVLRLVQPDDFDGRRLQADVVRILRAALVHLVLLNGAVLRVASQRMRDGDGVLAPTPGGGGEGGAMSPLSLN